jgi:alpha/beta superfamily hydrolase
MSIRVSARRTEARLTDASGAQQIVHFFGPEAERRFGVVHLPATSAVAGVVICPALHSDFERTYRRDVLLSRALCERGYAVHRFHYRGLGNSQGTSSDSTFDTMREDALQAAERLRAIGGVDRIGFAGTRWGGLVAASAAAGDGSAPLVLWEPAVHAERYFREATRARAVRDAKEGKPTSTWDDLRDEMDRTGSVDVLGYAIDAGLYRSAAGQELLGVLGNRSRPVLLVQMGAGRGLRREYLHVAEALGADGFEIETHSVEGEEHWWFVGGFWEAVETRASTRTLLDVTTGWFARWMPPSNATS